MAVDHYDEVYRETLEEHFAAELLAGLRAEGQSQFTDLDKRTLLAAIGSAVDQRETFCELLDNERASLESSSEALAAVVEDLDGTRVPAHVSIDFTERLGGRTTAPGDVRRPHLVTAHRRPRPL
jgi:hypothetical protein